MDDQANNSIMIIGPSDAWRGKLHCWLEGKVLRENIPKQAEHLTRLLKPLFIAFPSPNSPA